MTRSVAVVGFQEDSREYLEDSLRTDVHFFNAVSRAESIVWTPDYPFGERVETGYARLKDAAAEGIMTYWDFPASMLTAFIAERAGLPYAGTSAVMQCEHKYWFRQQQSKVTDTPGFCAFDPFADDPLAQIDLDYPFWIKPVVGHSSMLGFEIKSEEDFAEALSEIREGIELLTRPFRYPLDNVDMPKEIADLGATCCLAEEIISHGGQYTLEGYVRDGEVVVYGVVASIRHPNGHTFARYQYPARLPKGVEARMIDTTKKILAQIGYDGSPFNIEFFYNEDTGRLDVVELNSRLSQSHSDLFKKVDGQPHQQIAVALALDETPQWRRREGEFAMAAKCFLRKFEDATVTRVPTEEDFERLHVEMPDVRVDVAVHEGTRLSEMVEQESYSYEIADIFVGGADEDEIVRKYDRAVEILQFRYE
jgi:biotin carboxylase